MLPGRTEGNYKNLWVVLTASEPRMSHPKYEAGLLTTMQ